MELDFPLTLAVVPHCGECLGQHGHPFVEAIVLRVPGRDDRHRPWPSETRLLGSEVAQSAADRCDPTFEMACCDECLAFECRNARPRYAMRCSAVMVRSSSNAL